MGHFAGNFSPLAVLQCVFVDPCAVKH
jgi:hypothetical protein